jgi:hypothetical protein
LKKFQAVAMMKKQAESPGRRRPRGRPSKYTPEAVRAICEAISDGTPFKYAAAVGGISYETLCQWRRQFPEFSDAIEEATARGVHSRLRLIVTAAEEGSVRAATWWLEHVLPEHFSRSSVDLNHRIEGDLNHTHTVSPETLAAIAEVRARNENEKTIAD